MTSIELAGWAAAALTLVAFTPRNVQRLRLASVGPSAAFIVFAATTAAWTVLALHPLLLPITLRRLLELRTTSGARLWLCACGGRPVWLTMALLATPYPVVPLQPRMQSACIRGRSTLSGRAGSRRLTGASSNSPTCSTAIPRGMPCGCASTARRSSASSGIAHPTRWKTGRGALTRGLRLRRPRPE